jgi:hypothetical protein
MLEFNLEPLTEASWLIAQLMIGFNDPNVHKFDPAAVEHIKGVLDKLNRELVALDLDMTKKAAERLRSTLDPDRAPKDYAHDIHDVWLRLRDQIANTYCLTLSPEEYDLYHQKEPLFGKEVFDAFGSVREDIEEAGKCLALARGTAAVFHLMRVLESAAQTVANKIGAAVVDGDGKGLPWGVIADNMKPIIDRMLPKGGEEQIKWYRVQHELVVVNRAWRVPTNHPKETYTLEQARQVFDATKVFMKELSALV